jgi:hypothetical protein
VRRFVVAEGYIDVEKDLLGNDACLSQIFGDAGIGGFFGEMFVVPSAILPEPRRGLALKSLPRRGSNDRFANRWSGQAGKSSEA